MLRGKYEMFKFEKRNLWHLGESILLLLSLHLSTVGCGQESTSDIELDELPEALAGHMEMEPVRYTLHGEEYESGRTRIWYSS